MCYGQVLHLFIHSTNISCLDQPASFQAATAPTLELCRGASAQRQRDGTHSSFSDGWGRQQLLSPSFRQIEKSCTFFSAPTSGRRNGLEDTVWKEEMYCFLSILMGHGEWWSGYLKLGYIHSYMRSNTMGKEP